MRLADRRTPRSLASLENDPRSFQPPASRVAGGGGGGQEAAADRPRAAASGPGRPHGALRVTAAALCSHRRAVSHRPPRSRSRAHARAKAAAHFAAGAAPGAAAASSSSPTSSSSAAASASRLRPVPSSSPRELSQRFAPPRADWPAERAASQWSRSEAASPAALGLPAEPAAAVSRESAGAGPPPARPERRGAHAAGSVGAVGPGRAGRSEPGAPRSRRRSRADPAGGGGGRGRGDAAGGVVEQVRLPARASPASRACRRVARPPASGGSAAPLSPREREQTPRENVSRVPGSFGARGVGGHDEAVRSPPRRCRRRT